MSFALTTQQIRDRSKTVTRRLGWTFLKPGDLVRAVVKCQGLKKGEKVEPLAVLRIVKVKREPLHMAEQYEDIEIAREGFPEMDGGDFVTFFSKSHKCSEYAPVTRIEFEYV